MGKAKTVCFFTGKRGGFNHMIPVLERIDREKQLQYSIVASDMHLAKSFGETIKEVEKWAHHTHKVPTLLRTDSKLSRAKSLGVGIIKYAKLLARIKPDLVFVLGDRGEVLAFAISAMELNIPIVHLFGGDVTQGGVDEPVRHAITKLASIHLTSNRQSAERVMKMGEEPWRVHVVGSPVLDLISEGRFTPAEEIKEKFQLDLESPIILLLQHSVTWQVEEAEKQIRHTLRALDMFQLQTIAVYPCADPGYEKIVGALHEYERRPYFQLYRNIEFQDFWGLMNVATVFVGNSSAGVMETPSFKLPCINIGIRQKGRLRSVNVMDVGHDSSRIARAMKKILFDKSFRETLQMCRSPYGDGNASEKIVSILKEIRMGEKIIRKKMN